ncbi:hypothetical protein THIOKS1260010 [Thiocapsa sp. KS1]|nr:hypothetical protein THIOKS1260010 [Thiocapsa sp. KS1]
MGSSCIAGRTIYGLTACPMRFAYRLRGFATTSASPLRRHARADAYRGPLGLAPLSLPRGGAHRLGIALRQDGNNMELCTDVNPSRTGIDGGQRFGATALLGRDRLHDMALDSRTGSRAETARSITFLFGIAKRRHHTQTRNGPRATFFYGVNATKKQTASALEGDPSLCRKEFVRLQERGAPRGGFF